MDRVPVRPRVAGPYRRLLSALEPRLTLPAVNPSLYSAAGIGLAVVYLFAATPAAKIALIALMLAVDWLDGATARRYDRCSRAGYLTDVTADRSSEGFIFTSEAATPAGRLFFVLWLINIALSFYSIRSGRHTILPLRAAFLVVLACQALSGLVL
jgi:phosphatidylglycerophosphate synthase